MTDQCTEPMRADCARELGQLGSELSNLKNAQDCQSRKLNEIHQALVGNGRIGLVTRVTLLEQSAVAAEKRGDKFWKIFAVIVALTSVLVAVAK
ncbi:MAG: hypothetical protein ABFD92_16910 [Planctomycetaceae bacterium]|nr:hypothetical protein [Planctomycetaceae bacterium]